MQDAVTYQENTKASSLEDTKITLEKVMLQLRSEGCVEVSRQGRKERFYSRRDGLCQVTAHPIMWLSKDMLNQ